MDKKKRRKFDDLDPEEQIERLIVGRAVAILRAARGLNKKQLAIRMNLSPSTVLAFERGERDPDDKGRLDQYLQVLAVEHSDYQTAREMAQEINGWKPYEPVGSRLPESELREPDPELSDLSTSVQQGWGEYSERRSKANRLHLDLDKALLKLMGEAKKDQPS